MFNCRKTAILFLLTVLLVESNQQSECQYGQFTCADGNCIDEVNHCDGIKDCSDGSDENDNCKKITCPKYLFRCDYGACINKDSKCNGKNDCADGSDERGCRNTITTPTSNCDFGRFSCKNGECIDQFDLCDGKKDCSDGSDETADECAKINCPPYTYRCEYGACVSKSARCNGIYECADNSDENGCNGTATTVEPTTPKPTTPVPTLPTDIPTSGSCTVPTIDSGAFYNFGSTSIVRAGSKVPVNTIVDVKCDPRKKPDPNYSNFACIGPNLWTPPEFPKCLLTCRPLEKAAEYHLIVKCTDATGNKKSCEIPYEGFSAKLECEMFYENQVIKENPFRFCSDGSWDYGTYPCTPECGQKFVPPTTLIVGGKEVPKDHYPWTVGVYNSTFDHICGGSLLNMRVVVSAAHCFTNTNDGKPFPATDYHIAAGKHYRMYDHPDDHNAEYSDVQSFFVSEQYRGINQNHVGDIAIIVLKKVLPLNIAIRPVCLDRSDTYESQQLQEGNIGVVTGWGFSTETGRPSDVLKELSAPYYPEEKCKTLIQPSLEKFYTYDKLCVGLVNASQAACRGDSGGGLVFWNELTKRFYIRGIVSISPRSAESGGCDSNTVTLYTKISKHMDFITRYESMYRPK